MNLLKRLIKEEDGQAITEYALIIGLVVVVVIVVLGALGGKIKDVFQALVDAL